MKAYVCYNAEGVFLHVGLRGCLTYVHSGILVAFWLLGRSGGWDVHPCPVF